MKNRQDQEATQQSGTSRRRMLEMMGGLAVAVPVVGLSGCGGGDAPAQSSAPAAPAAGDSAAAEAQSAADSMAKMVDDKTGMVKEQVEAAEDKVGEMMSDAEDKAGEMMADAEEKAGEMMSDAKDMAGDMAEKANTIATDAVAKVDENGPQAMGLGYRHDATTVDTASQPRYAAGQQCSNCVLYQGGDAEWGGCGIFAGQQVKATGWCSAYTAAG